MNMPIRAKVNRALQLLNNHATLALSKLQFKHACLLCDTLNPELICEPCKHYFISSRHFCQRCAIPLKTHAIMCGECLKTPPAFDETIAAFLYQKPLDKLINNFKHNRHMVAGEAISTLFCEQINLQLKHHHKTSPDYLIAVPLHWRRQCHRGFNQTAFLSKALSNKLHIKELKSVKRIRAATTQEGLSRKQRLKNLKNSFSVDQSLQGKSIAIIDDVMTTGATANSLAATLKKAGAVKISIWVLARTPKAIK